MRMPNVNVTRFRRKEAANIDDKVIASIITDAEQSASNEVDGSVAPSRANNSHKRKAKATDNACVTRTTRSKASQNGRKPRNT